MKIKQVAYYIFIIFVISCSQNNDSDVNKRLGNFKNRPRGFQSVYMPQGQIALFVENNLGENSIIKNVRYFVGDKGNFSKPFKVMLYSVDTITGKPKDKLLPDTIIVYAINGNEWYCVDLFEYNLIFPANGIFVSMEWIPDDDFNVVSQTECQYLAYSKVKNENKTWYCALGINWYQLPDCEYNAMISMDVN